MNHPTFHARLLLIGDKVIVEATNGSNREEVTIASMRWNDREGAWWFSTEECHNEVITDVRNKGRYIVEHNPSHENQIHTITSYALCYPREVDEAMKMRDWLIYRDSTDVDDSEGDEASPVLIGTNPDLLDKVETALDEVTHRNPSLRDQIHPGTMEDCQYSSCSFPRQPGEEPNDGL